MESATFASATWPQNVIQLLDDHHLVVLCDASAARNRFRNTLGEHLRSLPETQVIEIDGGASADLASFARQLETQLHVSSKSWKEVSSKHSMHHLIDLLRAACSGPKRRYYMWRDADAMLEADVDLFCRLVNAIFGVAAECEHITLDPVMLQRVVFIGGAKLGAYAEDTNGQFCKWLEEKDQDSPFWEVMSMVDRPAVITYRVEG